MVRIYRNQIMTEIVRRRIDHNICIQMLLLEKLGGQTGTEQILRYKLESIDQKTERCRKL